MHQKKISKMRGITLVSLVVTIIVLIILAGVSINLVLGENGIITMAKRARENMELAKVDEERQLNELYDQIVTEGGSSGNASDDAIIKLAQFKREIASALTDIGIDTPENADISTMANNIRSLTGALNADKVSYDNTTSGLTSANVQGAVDEIDNEVDNLNNSLSDQPQFVYDETGKITGYTTKIGGADSVFPFSSGGCRIIENEVHFQFSEATWRDLSTEFSYNTDGYKYLVLSNIFVQRSSSDATTILRIYGDGTLLKSYSPSSYTSTWDAAIFDVSSYSNIKITINTNYMSNIYIDKLYFFN